MNRKQRWHHYSRMFAADLVKTQQYKGPVQAPLTRLCSISSSWGTSALSGTTRRSFWQISSRWTTRPLMPKRPAGLHYNVMLVSLSAENVAC